MDTRTAGPAGMIADIGMEFGSVTGNVKQLTGDLGALRGNFVALIGTLGSVSGALLAVAGPAGAAVGAVKDLVLGMVNSAAEMFGKLKSGILEMVGQYRPAIVEQYNRALTSLHMVFGAMFLPIVQTATRYVQQLADYMHSLPGGFKDVIVGVAKVGLVVGGLATVGLALGGVAAALAPFVSVAGVAVAAVGALAYAFARTSGGVQFFKDTLTFLEQGFAGVRAAGLAVWNMLAPVRERFGEAASGLGKALSALLDSLKPLLAANIATVAIIVKTALQFIIDQLTAFTKALTFVAHYVNDTLKMLNLSLGRLGFNFKLPDVNRPQLNAPRPVQADIVTDLNAFKNTLEKMIIENQAEGDKQQEDPVEKNTKDTVKQLEEVNANIGKLPAQFGAAAAAAIRAAVVAGPVGFGAAIFGP